MTVTAILPAFNEEVSIGSAVLHARQHADHVVVIDDGSKDRTSEMAKLAGAEVIRHPKNMGKGMALRTGFEHAEKNGCKIVITMDSDGQHDPDDIRKLVAPIFNGEADIVNGSRYMNGNDENTPFYRRIGQNILDKATNLNAGLQISDTQSGFRAFAWHTLPAFRFKSKGLAIESEMLMDAANAGFRIKEVSISARYDVDCSSENPIKHGLGVLANVIHDMELNRPLYYFTLPGAILSIIGLAMGFSFLKKFYDGGSLYFGPTLLMILFTLIGTFMVFTGIILHTVAKLITENTKKVNISSNSDPIAGPTVKHDSFYNSWNSS
ncbi:MAG TPA: glycosyltransferase family 2 protein [Candidatus Methanoperedens sp.]|nr:glycosyltransferase family 2 protein [Candidatus Methanoperedens sp.]